MKSPGCWGRRSEEGNGGRRGQEADYMVLCIRESVRCVLSSYISKGKVDGGTMIAKMRPKPRALL